MRRLLSSPETAVALVLRHSGASYADVAAALDVSPGSVGTTVRHAESALRKELVRHAPSDWRRFATAGPVVVFGAGFVVVAGLAQCVVVLVTVDYWPPEPAVALGLLAAQTIVLLTLSLLLSTAISPMASGIVAVGLFGATWVAGVVGAVWGCPRRKDL